MRKILLFLLKILMGCMESFPETDSNPTQSSCKSNLHRKQNYRKSAATYDAEDFSDVPVIFEEDDQ